MVAVGGRGGALAVVPCLYVVVFALVDRVARVRRVRGLCVLPRRVYFFGGNDAGALFGVGGRWRGDARGVGRGGV